MRRVLYFVDDFTNRSTLLFWVQCVGWMLYFVTQDAPVVASLFFAFALSYLGSVPLMIVMTILTWIIGIFVLVDDYLVHHFVRVVRSLFASTKRSLFRSLYRVR